MKFAKIALCLVVGFLLSAGSASADKSVAPVKAEPAKVVIPVQVKRVDLAGEGDGVQAKIVLPARLREAAAAKKVGLNEDVAPTQRSLVAAIALSLAAVSVVFVLRGKKLNTTSKAAVLGIAGLLGVFAAAQADIAIPGNKRTPRPVPPPTVAAPVPGAEKSMIVIEFSADVTDAVLSLPK